MKMKDVIEQTDLTDRAIRLYMENGLVSPLCSENYAGRKNIEFSESDVEALKNVATLRKAGFSIGEIKLLKLGDVPCRKTVKEFIEKTTTRIESDKAVVEKLELFNSCGRGLQQTPSEMDINDIVAKVTAEVLKHIGK